MTVTFYQANTGQKIYLASSNDSVFLCINEIYERARISKENQVWLTFTSGIPVPIENNYSLSSLIAEILNNDPMFSLTLDESKGKLSDDVIVYDRSIFQSLDSNSSPRDTFSGSTAWGDDNSDDDSGSILESSPNVMSTSIWHRLNSGTGESQQRQLFEDLVNNHFLYVYRMCEVLSSNFYHLRVLLEELKVQIRGLTLAYDNLKKHVHSIDETWLKLQVFGNRQIDLGKSLLASYAMDIKCLAAIPIHPALLKSGKIHSKHLIDFMDIEKVREIGSKKGSQMLDSVSTDLNNLSQEVEKLKSSCQEELSRTIDINTDEWEQKLKNIDSQLSNLLALKIRWENEREKFQGHKIEESISALDSNPKLFPQSDWINSTFKLQIESEVSSLIKQDQIIRQFASQINHSKIRIRQSHSSRMKRISSIQSSIPDCLSVFSSVSQSVRKIQSSLNVLLCAHRFPAAYGAMLVELIRRREYNKAVGKRLKAVVDVFSGIRAQEEKKRISFENEIAKYLPQELTHNILISAPPLLDLSSSVSNEHLPSLTKEDVLEFEKIVGGIKEKLESMGHGPAESLRKLQVALSQVTSHLDEVQPNLDKKFAKSLHYDNSPAPPEATDVNDHEKTRKKRSNTETGANPLQITSDFNAGSNSSLVESYKKRIQTLEKLLKDNYNKNEYSNDYNQLYKKYVALEKDYDRISRDNDLLIDELRKTKADNRFEDRESLKEYDKNDISNTKDASIQAFVEKPWVLELYRVAAELSKAYMWMKKQSNPGTDPVDEEIEDIFPMQVNDLPRRASEELEERLHHLLEQLRVEDLKTELENTLNVAKIGRRNMGLISSKEPIAIQLFQLPLSPEENLLFIYDHDISKWKAINASLILFEGEESPDERDTLFFVATADIKSIQHHSSSSESISKGGLDTSYRCQGKIRYQHYTNQSGSFQESQRSIMIPTSRKSNAVSALSTLLQRQGSGSLSMESSGKASPNDMITWRRSSLWFSTLRSSPSTAISMPQTPIFSSSIPTTEGFMQNNSNNATSTTGAVTTGQKFNTSSSNSEMRKGKFFLPFASPTKFRDSGGQWF